MRVLSLFDGIACGRVALERAGIPVDLYLASEVDKLAIQITRSNYSDIVQLGNAHTLDGTQLTPVDLLMGGSPCQGFSIAGQGRAFDDERSALVFDFIRILDECKPAYWLLENVLMKQEHIDFISFLLGQTPLLIDSAVFSAQ